MKLNFDTTKKFDKDVKLALKRGKDINKLHAIVDKLIKRLPLDKNNRDHILTNNYIGHRECHIEPDWLLIYKKDSVSLLLVRTGTHSDLFK